MEAKTSLLIKLPAAWGVRYVVSALQVIKRSSVKKQEKRSKLKVTPA